MMATRESIPLLKSLSKYHSMIKPFSLFQRSSCGYGGLSRACISNVYFSTTCHNCGSKMETQVKMVKDQVNEAISILRNEDKRNFNEDAILEAAMLPPLVKKLGYRMKWIHQKSVKVKEDMDVYAQLPTTDVSKLCPRPPIVAVMGHVDHGKTTILDKLRKTSVAAGEAGGITQSIGAFSVPLTTGLPVTFLDTPGHAVFTIMRERGAKVTDIIVLVVAADDGVMEQTIESINMAKMAEATIVVALNKCDKSEAQPDLVIEELKSYGVVCEEVGGDIQAVRISALKNLGLDNLVRSIVTQAELLELKADPEMQCEAMVIESRMEKGKGPMASVIIRQGTLKQGKILIAGTSMAKVRQIFDSNGVKIASAGPGTPVDIMGWRSRPVAGQLVLEVESEARAKQALRQREMELKLLAEDEICETVEERRKIEREEYEDIKRQFFYKRERVTQSWKLAREKNRASDDTPELNIIVKADVDGSLEAIMTVLNSYDREDQCILKVICHGVGELVASEMGLAEKFEAVIFLFNTNLSPEVQKLDDGLVPIYKHKVIYHFVHDLKKKIEEILLPLEVTIVEGEASVVKTFPARGKHLKMEIAGCAVQKGEINITKQHRVIRDNIVVHIGNLASLHQHNKTVTEVAKGSECGVLFEETDDDFNVQIGDKIQCLSATTEKAKLEWRPPGF